MIFSLLSLFNLIEDHFPQIKMWNLKKKNCKKKKLKIMLIIGKHHSSY